jgi:glucosamine--fructose-6-phosphate aminotransferase (isomerizing)
VSVSEALPGAPDPWAASEMPQWRDAPPYLMTEMIAAEPALAERLARRLASDPAVAEVASAVRAAADSGAAITLTGCGTSEHAAMAGAEILNAALVAAGSPPVANAVQALETLRRPQPGGLLIAVSHEGGTEATIEAMRAAAGAGARIALVTVSGRSPAAGHAGLLMETAEQDRSWCHTVGYLSPVVALSAVAALVADDALDAVALRALLDAADQPLVAEEVAARLLPCGRLIVAGFGIDYVTARELALKIEEGARLPAVAHQLETVRHGHLAAADRRTGLLLVWSDAEELPPTVLGRLLGLLEAARALGMPAGAILDVANGPRVPLALTPAGRLSIPGTRRMQRAAEGLAGAAIPLQQLTERLARARGVNPDTLAREDRRQAAAGG